MRIKSARTWMGNVLNCTPEVMAVSSSLNFTAGDFRINAIGVNRLDPDCPISDRPELALYSAASIGDANAERINSNRQQRSAIRYDSSPIYIPVKARIVN